MHLVHKVTTLRGQSRVNHFLSDSISLITSGSISTVDVDEYFKLAVVPLSSRYQESRYFCLDGRLSSPNLFYRLLDQSLWGLNITHSYGRDHCGALPERLTNSHFISHYSSSLFLFEYNWYHEIETKTLYVRAWLMVVQAGPKETNYLNRYLGISYAHSYEPILSLSLLLERHGEQSDSA